MNVQDECIKIHSKFGMSEMANYKIQLLFDSEIEKVKKEYEEKLRWIPTSEQIPTATEIGDWDGKRSDFVLAKTKNGSHYILRVYEGFSNGEKWVDWADKNDMIHTGIVEWRSFL